MPPPHTWRPKPCCSRSDRRHRRRPGRPTRHIRFRGEDCSSRHPGWASESVSGHRDNPRYSHPRPSRRRIGPMGAGSRSGRCRTRRYYRHRRRNRSRCGPRSSPPRPRALASAPIPSELPGSRPPGLPPPPGHAALDLAFPTPRVAETAAAGTPALPASHGPCSSRYACRAIQERAKRPATSAQLKKREGDPARGHGPPRCYARSGSVRIRTGRRQVRC